MSKQSAYCRESLFIQPKIEAQNINIVGIIACEGTIRLASHTGKWSKTYSPAFIGNFGWSFIEDKLVIASNFMKDIL